MHIAFIGDAIIDRWVHGRLEDCQDGCKKFVEESYCESPGGVANARMCLSNWDAITSHYTQPEAQRSIKTRFLENNRIIFRHDIEKPCIPGDWLSILYSADAVLVSDYDKGFLTPEYLRLLIDTANVRNIPIVVDAKRDPSLYAGAIIKCNKDYFEKFEVPQTNLVLTIGSTPPTVWHNGIVQSAGNMFSLAAVQCVNHVGAGDCFAAHLILGLAQGKSLADAAIVAHSAGRVYVQHPHNRPPLPEEISRDLELT
jgi:bifunctional ADP-heptose synthase (sugar kinase/adenylyltransferase)